MDQAKQAIQRAYNGEAAVRLVTEETEVEKTKRSKLGEFMKTLRTGSGNSSNELENYLNSIVADESTDVLKWWEIHKDTYPTLVKLARYYLCTQASSVAAESVFSSGVDLLPPTRSSLKETTIEACMAFKNWIKAERKWGKQSKQL